MDDIRIKNVLYSRDANRFKYDSFVHDFFCFVEDFQLLHMELWDRFVQQFREDADYDSGWRGEYWGKMMRAASLVYSYTQNPKLYDVLQKTVKDMICTADNDGRISSYAVNHEFEGWDMWSRKYVILGMEYFLEVCTDEQLKKDIISSICKQTDYLIRKIGDEPGKIPITAASCNWRGLNSSSILEPIVRLYCISGKQEYLDFATYIVHCGGTDVFNIFEAAYEDKLYPYQYPVTKAYEMISCFEGLLEYSKITGNEKYKKAVINFADRILESDFTVIGSCGCHYEVFDHSTVRQANTTNSKIKQETCVTVTLMKFLYRVYMLTGNPKYADAFEISFYNAYLGTFNTEKAIGRSMFVDDAPDCIIEPLPFDSYSPLTVGARGNEIGGFKVMSDKHYYGCCACIGSAGMGLVPKMQVLNSVKGIVFNMFINGTIKTVSPANNELVFDMNTSYPKQGKVLITLKSDVEEQFEIHIRNPYWSKSTVVAVNGNPADIEDGYVKLKRTWKNGDTIDIEFDMRTEAIYPISYGSDTLMTEYTGSGKDEHVVPRTDTEDPMAKKHIALRRGPIMLAQENRLGYDVESPVDISINETGYVDAIETNKEIPYACIVKCDIPTTDGDYMTVTDYSSAGKLWTEENKMAVWMLTK